MTRIRTYSEVVRLATFEERFEYLKLDGIVGESTFGFDRWLNQRFYTSREWKSVRSFVIYRDFGADLGCEGYEIHHGPIVHHINPLSMGDFASGDKRLMDPDNLILTTHSTHNAIHFGDASLLRRGPVERVPGDTKLW
jgi:hypothetical protein